MFIFCEELWNKSRQTSGIHQPAFQPSSVLWFSHTRKLSFLRTGVMLIGRENMHDDLRGTECRNKKNVCLCG